MRPTALCSIAVAAACAACFPQSTSTPGGMMGGETSAGSFSGSFATEGATLQLQESGGQVAGTISGGGMTGQVAGTVSGGMLSGTITMSDGSSGQFVAYASAEGIQLVVQGRQPVVFARAGGAGAVAAAPAAPVEPAKSVAAKTTGSVPAPKARAASGPAYRDDMDGWEVRTPDAWKYGVKGNTVLFGSDTEAGFIIVAFNRGVTFEQMEAGASAYIAQLGATQVGQTRRYKARGGQALIAEMTGVTPDGSSLHARSIGVAGPSGVLSITGITTPQKIAGLRKRVDGIAMSARFFAPKRTAAMANLVGPWWHYHGSDTGISSSYGGVSASYERTIELCADGTFFDSDNSNIYATTKNPTATGVDTWGNPYRGSEVSSSYNRDGAGNGRWTATGNHATGRLRLVFNNGNVEERAYLFQQNGDIQLDGRWYGRARDKGGQCR